MIFKPAGACMADISHVVGGRQHMLALSVVERMIICGDDFWIPMQRYDKYLKIINKILTRRNQHQAQCVLFTSYYGGGKTAFLNHLLDVYSFKDEKLLKIQMEENLDKFKLKDLICNAFDLKAAGRGPRASRSAMIRRAIQEGNYKAIVCDETHDALKESHRTLLQNLSLLKHMAGGIYNLSILAFGDSDAAEMVFADGQTGRRFVQYVLPGWNCDDEFKEFVCSYVAHLPLQLPSEDVVKKEFLLKLYKESWGIMDNFVKILKSAAEIGIETGEERITMEHLKNAKDICDQCGYALQKPGLNAKRIRRGK